MSTAYYIVVNSPDPPFDTFVNGKAISRASAKLLNAAAALGVKSLDDFVRVSFEAAAEELGLDDAIVDSQEPERWFEPEDGLETVRALSGTVVAQPDRFDGKVAAELEEFARVLEAAKAAKLKWHLAIDY